MTKIQQPPAPAVFNTGRAEVAKPVTTAKQTAAPQQQTRTAAPQDGFQAAKAAPMVLNPAPQAFAAQAQAQVGPAGDVLPTGTVDNNTPVTDQELDKAIDDAFKQQYNGTKTPTDELRNQWRTEAQKMVKDAGGSKEFLAEKIFTALNKAVSSGNGPSPLPATNNTQEASQQELEAAVKAAFAQQFNGKREPNANELAAWSNKAKDIIKAAGGNKEFLAEKLFTEINKVVSK